MDSIDTTSVERFLEPHLPRDGPDVFVTATWAQSLDGRIAAAPGERTQLSGMYSKKMTHFIRTRHDAILVGRQTVAADNPRLNSRYSPSAPSPQPVILDSALKWDVTPENWREWQVLDNAAKGKGRAPWVVVSTDVDPVKRGIIERAGGRILRVASTRDWRAVCSVLRAAGIRSLMVEGGADVLDSCMQSGVVSTVVVTIAPVFLGRNGVQLTPRRQLALSGTEWWRDPAVPDAVLAGTVPVPVSNGS